MGKTDKGNEFDVIVIGGGATGAGTARDCSMRGVSLDECSGTYERFAVRIRYSALHGLLGIEGQGRECDCNQRKSKFLCNRNKLIHRLLVKVINCYGGFESCPDVSLTITKVGKSGNGELYYRSY